MRLIPQAPGTREPLDSLTFADLTPAAQRAFERAYMRATRRPRCSRADFAAGWVAALVSMQAWSSFRPDRLAALKRKVPA
jgi:hypothetical protein